MYLAPKFSSFFIFLLLSTYYYDVVQGCTNILVTPGASEDGNPMIAYNADDYSLFGSLYHYPPSQNNGQKMRKCYSWDYGVSFQQQQQQQIILNFLFENSFIL